MYDMIADPPFAGAVQVSDTSVSPRVGVTAVGAFGIVAASALADVAEAAPVPVALIALTLTT